MRTFIPPIWIVGLLLATTLSSVSQTVDNDLVPYEETADTFVEWPDDAASQTLLQTRPESTIPDMYMNLWTTALDFRHPLFHVILGIVRRLDRRLLKFQPRYFLDSGNERGCRTTNQEDGEDVEVFPLSEYCRENCTNHGRYCAASKPQDLELAAKIRGTSIVEESLRRLCIWVVYGKTGGNNALHFFRYIDDLLFQQCDAPFGHNCTYTIMENNDIGSRFIERCMDHAGGVQNDVLNAYLFDEVENQAKRDLTIDMLPSLDIGGTFYYGEHSAKAIFRAVCAKYPVNNQPMACEFCKDCDDVRFCLWFLQCDGTPFAEYASQKLDLANGVALGSDETSSPEDEGATTKAPIYETPAEPIIPASAPVASSNSESAPATMETVPATPLPTSFEEGESSTPTSPTTSTTTGANSKTAPLDKADNEKEEALFHGVLIGLTIGFVISAMYGCKDWQARLILREISLDEGCKPSNNGLNRSDASLGRESILQRAPRRSTSFTPAVASDELDDSEGSSGSINGIMT